MADSHFEEVCWILSDCTLSSWVCCQLLWSVSTLLGCWHFRLNECYAAMPLVTVNVMYVSCKGFSQVGSRYNHCIDFKFGWCPCIHIPQEASLMHWCLSQLLCKAQQTTATCRTNTGTFKEHLPSIIFPAALQLTKCLLHHPTCPDQAIIETVSVYRLTNLMAFHACWCQGESRVCDNKWLHIHGKHRNHLQNQFNRH